MFNAKSWIDMRKYLSPDGLKPKAMLSCMIASILSTSTFALETSNLENGALNRASRNIFCGAMPANLDFKQLRSWIERCKPKTVADVVRRLPPQYKKNAAFVYKSRSKSEVEHPGTITPLYPRPILFGNRKFILTFTGKPGTPSYQEIETLEYNADARTFELKLIRINPNGVAAFDEKPASCVKCHGKASFPIWDEYRTWPGAYGSEHDFLNSDEWENFRSFSYSNSSDRNPRENPNGLMNDGRYAALDDKDHPLDVRFPGYKPNTQLSAVFTQLVAHSFAGKIQKLPEYQDILPAMFAEKLKCPNITPERIERYLKQVKRDRYYDPQSTAGSGGIVENPFSKYMPEFLQRSWVIYNPTGSGQLLPSAVVNWLVTDLLGKDSPLFNYFTQSPSAYENYNVSALRENVLNLSSATASSFCRGLEKKITVKN